MMSDYSLFATCPRGLETVLAAELSAQGVGNIVPTDGGVAGVGNLEAVYRANLHSRTASRVLVRVAHGRYRNEADLYRLAAAVNWGAWFDVSQTFRVGVEGRRAAVKSLEFIGLKTKDAVCDVFRAACGRRPSIDKFRPDVRLHVFLNEQEASFFIDSSGEPLFKRGYRHEAGEAPMRENLAAGLLLLAGYDGSQPFQDPFCGSGTIAIEAALLATRRAPGRLRRFGFEKWQNFDAALWERIRSEAEMQIVRPSERIAGSDYDARMLATAKANADAAEVGEAIDWAVCEVQNARPNGEKGILISNPPYGVRLEEVQTLHALYPQLGSWLKQQYAGWLVGMFTADRSMPKLMRLQPKRKIPLYNGNLDCRLFLFDMVKGSNRREAV